MKRIIIKRLLWMVVLLLCISIASFFLVFLMPGSIGEAAYESIYSSHPTEEQLDRFNHEYGFDRSLIVQYLDWLGRVLHGDFGKSLLDGDDVLSAYGQRLYASAQLFVTSQIVAISLALFIGTYTAWKANGVIDKFCRLFSSIFNAVPNFWFGALLIYVFAIKLHWVSVSGYGKISNIVLPTLTIGITQAASLVRIVRTSVLETLSTNYVRTARAKGIKESRVLISHALRNALAPIITAISGNLFLLFTGTAVIESVFAWPGVGSYLLRIANHKDIFAIQGFVLLTALFYSVSNLVIDLLYIKVIPESRLEELL